MKKLMSLVFAVAFVGLSSAAFAADAGANPYAAFAEKAAPIEQQLYAKQAELAGIYASAQPDTAKAQQLFQEIGALRGRLFALQAELRNQAGDAGQYGPYGMPCGNYGMGMGMGGYGHRGGMMGGMGGGRGWGHGGGMMGGGRHHGGW